MSQLLRKMLSHPMPPRFQLRSPKNPITKKRLQQILPSTSDNLEMAISRFLEGVSEGDKEFISSITTAPLFSQLEPSLNLIEQGTVRLQLKKMFSENNQPLKMNTIIYPYVILGANVQEYNLEGVEVFQWTSGRYIRKKSKEESWKEWFKSLQAKIVYGFECRSQTANTGRLIQDYEVTQLDEIILKINFETNHNQLDYVITNVQDILSDK